MSGTATPKLSGRQIAVQYVERFKTWVAERDVAKDWDDYVRCDTLNRSEIARECDFLRSVFSTNPGVSKALFELESRLRQEGLLPSISSQTAGVQQGNEGSADADVPEAGAAMTDPAARLALRRANGAKAKAEERVKALEEQNATLRAEVKGLRDQVRKLSFMDEHLALSGRLPHP